jgi:hypothetical protein
MSDQSKGTGAPIWVFAVAFVAVAIASAAIGWIIAGVRPAAVPTGPGPVATSTADASPTVPPETRPTVTPTPTVEPTTTPPPPKPKTTKEWAFLTGGSASGGKLYIKADYIYFYAAGTAANNARTKYGGSLRPDGSYVRNLSSAIKTLTLRPTAKIQLVEWLETGTAGSSWKYGTADPNAFVAVLAGTATSPSGVWSPDDKPILLTVTGSTVSEVKQYTTGP